jgi:hypothetical protein
VLHDVCSVHRIVRNCGECVQSWLTSSSFVTCLCLLGTRIIFLEINMFLSVSSAVMAVTGRYKCSGSVLYAVGDKIGWKLGENRCTGAKRFLAHRREAGGLLSYVFAFAKITLKAKLHR